MAASNETKKGHEITCTLKLSDTSKKGWHKIISKVLKTIEGVSYSIDMENKKVIVMGNINPQALLSRLAKSGKHATLERVDSGALLQSRKAKLLKEKQKNEYLDYAATFGHPYQQYGYANADCAYSNYPQQYGYYSHRTGPGYARAGYPYGTAPDHYYGSSTHHPNNYYQHQQPYVPPAPPLGFRSRRRRGWIIITRIMIRIRQDAQLCDRSVISGLVFWSSSFFFFFCMSSLFFCPFNQGDVEELFYLVVLILRVFVENQSIVVLNGFLHPFSMM